eukprot:gene14142-30108_t
MSVDQKLKINYKGALQELLIKTYRDEVVVPKYSHENDISGFTMIVTVTDRTGKFNKSCHGLLMLKKKDAEQSAAENMLAFFMGGGKLFDVEGAVTAPEGEIIIEHPTIGTYGTLEATDSSEMTLVATSPMDATVVATSLAAVPSRRNPKGLLQELLVKKYRDDVEVSYVHDLEMTPFTVTVTVTVKRGVGNKTCRCKKQLQGYRMSTKKEAEQSAAERMLTYLEEEGGRTIENDEDEDEDANNDEDRCDDNNDQCVEGAVAGSDGSVDATTTAAAAVGTAVAVVSESVSPSRRNPKGLLQELLVKKYRDD